MKRSIIKWTIIIIVIVCVAGYFVITRPYAYNHTYDAVIYRLGNAMYCEKTTIQIIGYFRNPFVLSKNSFEGTIIIGGKTYSGVKVSFDEFNRGLLSYNSAEDTGNRFYIPLGDFFISSDKSKLTICFLEPDGSKNGKSWTGTNGLMLSAPANDRDAALQISNELMDEVIIRSLK